MTRTFDHFPKGSKCPICRTNDDGECFLIPIDDTEEDGNVEAQPVHIECMKTYAGKFRLNREIGVIYTPITDS